MIILDASVAIKWFVNEPHGDIAAWNILLGVQNNPSGYAVPELFFAEMLNVLCRVYIDSTKVSEAILILEQLGIERVGLGHELLLTAGQLAQQYGISGYDAIYVATARLLGGQWLTFDLAAKKKLKVLNVAITPE